MPLINQVPMSFYKGWKSLNPSLTKEEREALIITAVIIGIILLVAHFTGYTDLEGIN
jgi:Sec-independent protein secretion pathway component TatC